VLDGERLGRFGHADVSGVPPPGDSRVLTGVKAHNAN
jgi:hypothetical protein